ncbi:hypothetical protein [Hydrocarboniclastica marina]|uniref:Type IV pilus biogenesis protein PilP n=1 Tax=Hydrocarboniclastica marina TaxID=2259620 RepID=A0A4P7XI85_9ALTE|nr:hypothetical protein [Hydrocarboniclastica marina]QCF26224.1 hypothetical protein soil367_09935 [Hydrocarboniclastica marina]
MSASRALLFLAVLSAPVSAIAGVESLSSEEMVDTYVKDSAIIVVPRQRDETAQPERDQVIQTISISPGEPVITETDMARVRERILASQRASMRDTEALAREQQIRDTLDRPLDELAAIQPTMQTMPEMPNLVYGQTPQIPDEPFTETYLNNQLGLAFDGQNLQFSIGNLPGVSQINIPQGINEGPIQLTPRPGGGFDLNIAVPDAQ